MVEDSNPTYSERSLTPLSEDHDAKDLAACLDAELDWDLANLRFHACTAAMLA